MKKILLSILFAHFTNLGFSQVPTASFTAPDTACQGSIITFTNTSSGGTAPLSYIWDFGNQEVLNNVQNPTYAYTTPGNFIVTLVITDANGFSASASQLIKILGPPFAVISTSAADQVGCSPHLVTFLNLTVQPPSYNPLNHFDWSFSDGTPVITTLPVPIAVPATPQTSLQHTFIGEGAPSTIIGLNSYTATITAYNNFGCSSVSTYEIYLIPLPTATAGGSQTICSNSSATVSGASSLNGTIFWTHNGEGNITNGQGTLSPTYSSVIEDAGNTVTLTMTVSSSYTLACSPPAIATFTIFVNPSSTNTTTASACETYTWNGQTYSSSGVYTGTTANCVTESLNLTISPSSTNTTPISACNSYVWNGTNYTSSGVYTGATINCVTQFLNLTITPSSTITQPASQSINISNNAQFIVGSSGSNAIYQWQTDLGIGFQNLNSVGQYSGTSNNTLTVSNVTFSNNNQPFRCIVSSGSCTDTSDVAVLTVVNNVGFNDLSTSKLSIYPNPTNGDFTITGLELVGTVSSLILTDMNGKVVKVLDTKATKFTMGGIKPGVYFLNILSGNKQEVLKIVKE
jgi:PKD repeat protein